jgi:hypothetical protein
MRALRCLFPVLALLWFAATVDDRDLVRSGGW